MSLKVVKNPLEVFPEAGAFLRITNQGIVLSAEISKKFKDFKRVLLLFDRENWTLGICPIKSRMPNSFSLGFITRRKGEKKENRRILAKDWIKNEVLSHIKVLGVDVFKITKRTNVPEFEGEEVWLAQLTNGK